MLDRLTAADFHRIVLDAFPALPEEPLVVFDIDSTIMHTGYRNLRILEEASLRWTEISPAVAELDADSLGWNITGPLETSGIDDGELLERIREFWEKRFFTDEYLAADRPYPGVKEFLEELTRKGYILLYLTGRDAPGMQTGTRESFLRHLIPEGEFIFKPAKEMPDLAFKEEAMQRLHRHGTVVAAVENEPANANLFKERFPEAEVFLFESITSPQPAVPRPDLRRFRAFAG